jgi:hypothetical protein
MISLHVLTRFKDPNALELIANDVRTAAAKAAHDAETGLRAAH